MPGRSALDATFAAGILQGKYREKCNKLHFVFVDLEKAYDGF